MRMERLTQVLGCLILGIGLAIPATAERATSNTELPDTVVPSRVVDRIDESKLVRLVGNTHPFAKPKYDRGLQDPGKLLERIVLTLKRSPEQEQALASFNERQYDPKSPDFHHWLEPEEFGKLYGPSDNDIVALSSWLQNHGFRIDRVSKGRVTLEFTGTVEQVQNAFHVEMHKYLVNGEEHISNDRDPQIPAALSPVVTGLFSLNDFFPKPQHILGPKVKLDTKTGRVKLADSAAENSSGLLPQLGYGDQEGNVRMDVTPADFAKIYNEDPLFTASTPINGTGVTVAISGVSDVQTNDFNSFRKAFGLPAQTLKTIIAEGSSDPGYDTTNGGEEENTLDVEWSGATAPGAQIEIIVSKSTSTTPSVLLSPMYIIDNKVAPIMSASYGGCELGIGTSGNSTFNQLWQQGATQGISLFESSGDQGSAGCTSQDGQPPNADSLGLQVNGEASPPWITAVGGTDLNWNWWDQSGNPPAWEKYWATSNGTDFETALGYVPEVPWNSTCTSTVLLNDVFVSSGTPEFTTAEGLCNAAANNSTYGGLVSIGSGSGGPSHCTTNDSDTSSTLDPTSCSGGYAKPSWQAGVTGIPNDGHRDLPDVSFMAAGSFLTGYGAGDLPSSSLVFCYDQGGTAGCAYTSDTTVEAQEIGGTSASSPAMAGVMAVIVQKQGGKWQGLANPPLYALAAKQTYSNCNTNTVTTSSSCYFNDIVSGTNAMVCNAGGVDCVVKTSGDTYGVLSGYSSNVGYDMTTGLGSLNVANVVNGWSSVAAAATITLSPTSLTFASTAEGSTTAAQVVTVKNTGSASATLTSETITGTNASSFIKSATTCGSTLAASASCTVSIEFKPAATGALTASLSVADSATGSPQTVKLTGTGTAAAAPAITLSPTTLTFPSTAIGATSAAQTVTVKNTGGASASLTSETFTGANASSFIKSATTCGSTLAAAASCTISIEFKAPSAGTKTATLDVADNATGSPQTVALTGTGAAATTPTITLSPTSIAFPETVTGATSDAQTVTIQNTGSVAVTISSIAVGGTNATSFLDLNGCGTSLASGASCSVYVAFKPASAAALTGTLSVTDTATGSPQKVTLTGTGTAADSVTLSATTLAFGTVTHGTTSEEKSITLTNSGKATLNLTSITLAGTNPGDFEELNTCGATLAPAANCVVYVAFKPAAAAAYKATLTITDSGASSPQSVTLTGTGD